MKLTSPKSLGLTTTLTSLQVEMMNWQRAARRRALMARALGAVAARSTKHAVRLTCHNGDGAVLSQRVSLAKPWRPGVECRGRTWTRLKLLVDRIMH